jgi:hypothetical protein
MRDLLCRDCPTESDNQQEVNEFEPIRLEKNGNRAFRIWLIKIRSENIPEMVLLDGQVWRMKLKRFDQAARPLGVAVKRDWELLLDSFQLG